MFVLRRYCMYTAQSRECVADSQNQESYEFRSKDCIRSQSLDYDTAQSVRTFSSSLHASTVTGQTALRKGARRFRQHHRDRLCALTLICRNSPKLCLPSSWPPESQTKLLRLWNDPSIFSSWSKQFSSFQARDRS